MSSDQHIQKGLQNKIGAIFQPKGKTVSDEIWSGPHRLVGTEIWLENDGREKILLEGVTGIEFREGKILFQTVLGERLILQTEWTRVTLRESGFILQMK
ncbi:MAG: CooT family nickel-binding protein [Nitrospirae bacterium]|nr:CooT family nickel-binding protein [Candidatus Manganitrophaceae bacterium]